MDGGLILLLAVYLIIAWILALAQLVENHCGRRPEFKAPVWWVAIMWPALLVWVLIDRVREGRWV